MEGMFWDPHLCKVLVRSEQSGQSDRCLSCLGHAPLLLLLLDLLHLHLRLSAAGLEKRKRKTLNTNKQIHAKASSFNIGLPKCVYVEH